MLVMKEIIECVKSTIFLYGNEEKKAPLFVRVKNKFKAKSEADRV